MSLPKYPQYKHCESWLGHVPVDWDVARLMWVASVNDDVLPESTRPSYELEYVDIGSVNLDRGIERTERVSFSEAPSRARRLVRNGDILVSTVRTYLKAIASVANPPENLVVSTGFAVVRPNSKFASGYAKYVLQTTGFVDEVISRSTGVSYPAINATDLVRICVPIPSTIEQTAIAAFLDREIAKIDALIAEQEKLIALLAEKRQATVFHAVTKGLNPDAPMTDSGVAWLGKYPAHWGKGKKLVELVATHQHSFVNGPFGSDLLTSELVEEGIPVVYIRDIKEEGYKRVSEWCVTQEKAQQLAFCNVLPGDVIVAKVGDPPGIAAVYPQGEVPGIVTQDVIRMRLNPSKALPEYMCWLLNSAYAQTAIDQISVESTRTRVGLGEYKQMRLHLPPLSEQATISTYLGSKIGRLNSLAQKARHGITLLKARRSALIAAAVTGQIDVRGAIFQVAIERPEAIAA